MEEIADGLARRLAIADVKDLQVITLDEAVGMEVRRFWVIGKLLTSKEYNNEGFVSTMKRI